MMILVGGYTALRWSELVALKRDDIDLENLRITVNEAVPEVDGDFDWKDTKTDDSHRTLDLPRFLAKQFREHFLAFPPLIDRDDERENGVVFSGIKGGLVRRHSFRPTFLELCAAAEVEPIQVRWLRHTGLSIAHHETHDLLAVAAMAGHTSTRMLEDVYVKLYKDQERTIGDALDAAHERAQEGR
jgi:integrase